MGGGGCGGGGWEIRRRLGGDWAEIGRAGAARGVSGNTRGDTPHGEREWRQAAAVSQVAPRGCSRDVAGLPARVRTRATLLERGVDLTWRGADEVRGEECVIYRCVGLAREGEWPPLGLLGVGNLHLADARVTL